MAAMSTISEDCYWGKSHNELVERQMTNSAPDGSYLVFHTGDTEYMTLVYKVQGAVRCAPIYFRDELYGFTEPLGFDSLGGLLEAFNASPTETNGILQHALPKPVLAKPTEETVDLLKELRNLIRYKTHQESQLEETRNYIDELEHKVDEHTNSIEAFSALTRTLAMQKEKCLRLANECKTNENADAFNSNMELIESKITEMTLTIKQRSNTRSMTQDDISRVSRDHATCFTQLQDIESDINSVKDRLISVALYYDRVDSLMTFLDGLLNTADNSRHIPIPMLQDFAKKEIKGHLSTCVEGTYMVCKERDSNTSRLYVLSFSYWDEERNKIAVAILNILRVSEYYGLDENTCIFETLQDLIVCYTTVPFSVHDVKFGNVVLTEQLVIQPATRQRRRVSLHDVDTSGSRV